MLFKKSSAETYRYGYQGSEQNIEVDNGGGNFYTTEFRQLDARFGRWFTTDPVFFAHQSPYNSMDGNPINITDPTGLYGESDYIDDHGEVVSRQYSGGEDGGPRTKLVEYSDGTIIEFIEKAGQGGTYWQTVELYKPCEVLLKEEIAANGFQDLDLEKLGISGVNVHIEVKGKFEYKHQSDHVFTGNVKNFRVEEVSFYISDVVEGQEEGKITFDLTYTLYMNFSAWSGAYDPSTNTMSSSENYGINELLYVAYVSAENNIGSTWWKHQQAAERGLKEGLLMMAGMKIKGYVNQGAKVINVVPKGPTLNNLVFTEAEKSALKSATGYSTQKIVNGKAIISDFGFYSKTSSSQITTIKGAFKRNGATSIKITTNGANEAMKKILETRMNNGKTIFGG